MQLNGFSFWSWFSCIFRSSDLWIYNCVKSSWMVFHFGPDFHDLQISRIFVFQTHWMQPKGVSFCCWFLYCIFRSVGLPNLETDWVQLNSFSFSADFYVPSEQQDLQIYCKEAWGAKKISRRWGTLLYEVKLIILLSGSKRNARNSFTVLGIITFYFKLNVIIR